MGVNLDGVFFGMKHQARHMLAHGGGAIVNVSHRRVPVNALAPGAILTPMMAAIIENHPGQADAANDAVPMKRLGRPEEVANTIVWLCSEEASDITGQVIGVDGGLSATG